MQEVYDAKSVRVKLIKQLLGQLLAFISAQLPDLQEALATSLDAFGIQAEQNAPLSAKQSNSTEEACTGAIIGRLYQPCTYIWKSELLLLQLDSVNYCP